MPTRLTHGAVFAIALPTTLAFMTTPLIGIVDTAVVGRLGQAAPLGGLAAGAIVFDLVFGSFNFLRSGTTGLVAQASGRNDALEEQAILVRALLIGLAFGLVIAIAGPLIGWAGRAFMSAEPAVSVAMTDYILIRALSAPFALGNYSLLGTLLGRGQSGAALGLQIIVNGSNIVLSILLGLVFGWGLEGVALGTVFGEMIGFAAGLALMARIYRTNGRPSLARIMDRPAFGRLLALNRDIMIRTFALLSVFALFTRAGAGIGTVQLAANAILLNFFMFGSYLLDGFATAAERFVGHAIGARHREPFLRAIKLTALWGFVFAFGVAAVFYLAGDEIIALMTTAPDVRRVAGIWLPLAALTPISGVLAFQMDGAFIGATWGAAMRNMMLVALALFLGALFLIVPSFGNGALWAALHIFLLARGLLLLAILPMMMNREFSPPKDARPIP
ncbi:MATE family efflux transporter [Notoacmeibacter ruber]|uniref:MATE family efflux transporter n=1 Tax=Notoacmeibacter ruber TaxID=2670375 RepID=A0A3L7JF32_9HYPH|nr:MATE family efflux transporter [Notoacmeibacter ruber]RLQ89337.1 MATE family efflux transporter [Notoacmeibacter ruber]